MVFSAQNYITYSQINLKQILGFLTEGSNLQRGFDLLILTRPRGYKKNLCSTQLSTKFQLLIKANIPTNEDVSCSDVVFIMLINVKMPTILLAF